ncbi:MAG: cytochrome c1 [Betaproteobacteria bacterium]|nr:MAG: cytochrome c1 [Betaproteobacteria bacterium]
MKKLIAILLLAVPALAFASSGGARLDSAPVNLHDKLSLQRGAQIFVNHCLNCHGASAMRYSKLTEIGLNEGQIRENLMFATDKVGDPMTSTLDPKEGKAWFGVMPPDLSLVARARGADWLYTYLRGFYRDPAAKTGWNNTVFPNVGMPHVLWEYQGGQVLQAAEHGAGKLVLAEPGKLPPAEYDKYVGDLVNYLVYMGEPARAKRVQIGIVVMFFLAVFFVITVLLKKEYWKDVR